MLGIYRRWIDAERLAGSTSRIALAGPVEVLLSLARETDALSVPACLQRGHEALRRLTQQSAETYVQFMRRNEVASMIYEWVSRPDSIVGFEYELRLASCKRVQ